MTAALIPSERYLQYIVTVRKSPLKYRAGICWTTKVKVRRRSVYFTKRCSFFFFFYQNANFNSGVNEFWQGSAHSSVTRRENRDSPICDANRFDFFGRDRIKFGRWPCDTPRVFHRQFLVINAIFHRVFGWKKKQPKIIRLLVCVD